MPAPIYLIGITGPSGAGKSFLAANVARKLNAQVLATDSYYHDLGRFPVDDRAEWNFDDPAALDHALLIEHLLLLAEGNAAHVPVYDFATHTRTTETRQIESSGVVIVEGLFALQWHELRALFGTKVYVDLQDDLCLERRMARDVHERGRTPESVLRQYVATVAPMAERFVRPTVAYADVIVSGRDPIDGSVTRVVDHCLSRGGTFEREQRIGSI